MKTISCIVPAYNEEKDLRATLAVVTSCIGSVLHEVIVIDDASQDSTSSIVKEFPTVKLIEHIKNLGKSKSVADGIEQATGDYVFLLDADLVHLGIENIQAIVAPIAEGKADVAMVYIKNAWPLFPFKKIDYLSGQRVLAKKAIMPHIKEMKQLPSYGLEVFLNKIIIKNRMRLAVVSWPEVENNFNQHKHGWLQGIRIVAKIWMNVISTVGIVGMYVQNIQLRNLLIKDGLRQKISFVIPAYNEEKVLGKCLDSVFKELNANDYDAEVIVVNNNSTDKTKEIASAYPGVKVIDETHQGLVHARKAGFLASTGDLIANIDADTMLPKGWVQKVMTAFSKDEDIVALSGPYIYYDLSFITRVLVKVFYAIGYVVYLFSHFILGRGGMLQGGNFIVRRVALVEVGGFDTSIEFYGEDTDIARRISKAGKVVWTFTLPMYTSGRRLMKEGVVTTGLTYAINFFWVLVFGEPFTRSHKDIRL